MRQAASLTDTDFAPGPAAGVAPAGAGAGGDRATSGQMQRQHTFTCPKQTQRSTAAVQPEQPCNTTLAAPTPLHLSPCPAADAAP